MADGQFAGRFYAGSALNTVDGDLRPPAEVDQMLVPPQLPDCAQLASRLGIDPTRSGWRRALLTYHPDQRPSPAAVKRLGDLLNRPLFFDTPSAARAIQNCFGGNAYPSSTDDVAGGHSFQVLPLDTFLQSLRTVVQTSPGVRWTIGIARPDSALSLLRGAPATASMALNIFGTDLRAEPALLPRLPGPVTTATRRA